MRAVVGWVILAVIFGGGFCWLARQDGWVETLYVVAMSVAFTAAVWLGCYLIWGAS